MLGRIPELPRRLPVEVYRRIAQELAPNAPVGQGCRAPMPLDGPTAISTAWPWQSPQRSPAASVACVIRKTTSGSTASGRRVVGGPLWGSLFRLRCQAWRGMVDACMPVGRLLGRGSYMTSESRFVLKVLRDLQSRTEAAAKRYPGLRHILVLPPGERIRVPPPPGGHPVGWGSVGQHFRTHRFGETELVGPLPPRSSWPKEIEPLRAVVAEQEFSPYSPNLQEPYRIHLFFGGSDRAFECLRTLAHDLAGIRNDVTQALSRDSPSLPQEVFYTAGDCLHGTNAARLDSWLCTVHWWAWFWTQSPNRTQPQVIYARSTYETDPRDDAVWSKLAFSIFEADVLTASATTLSLILRFFEEPPSFGLYADYPPVPEAEDAPQSGETKPKKSLATQADWDALTDRQRNCMGALLELKAFDADSRRDARVIARKAEGRAANVNGFKEPLAELARRDLAQSKTGRRGGYWLTDHGRKLLAVADSQDSTDRSSS